MQGQVKAVRGVLSVACLGVVVLLSGCNNFFVCQKASCTDSGSTTSSNLVYVANGTSGQTYVAGYDVTKGTLTAATSSPFSLGITPTTMAVTQNNKYLYAASTSVSNGTSYSAGIYGWSLGTGGALSYINSGNALAGQTSVASMDVSADGQWLVVANGVDGSQLTITPYLISTSTGQLTAYTALAYAAPTGSSVYSLKVAPSGQYIALALATGGVMVFPFNTSTGAIGAGTSITFSSGSVGAYDVAIDSNNYLFIASTGAVVSYAVSSAGVPASTQVGSYTTASGGPFSVVVDGTSYVYAGAQNGTSNLIYGFSNSKGVLTALSTATIAAPATTTKLALDSTKAYLFAAGYDTSVGLRMYSIGSSGVLSSLATAGTGTTTGIATSIAATH